MGKDSIFSLVTGVTAAVLIMCFFSILYFMNQEESEMIMTILGKLIGILEFSVGFSIGTIIGGSTEE